MTKEIAAELAAMQKRYKEIYATTGLCDVNNWHVQVNENAMKELTDGKGITYKTRSDGRIDLHYQLDGVDFMAVAGIPVSQAILPDWVDRETAHETE